MSRKQRYERALGSISEGKQKIEELREELQNWLDNLPENLSQSKKAEELEQVIAELDEVIDDLELVEFTEIEFPTMCG